MDIDHTFALSMEVGQTPRGQNSPTKRYEIDVADAEVSYLGPVGRGVRGNIERDFVPFPLTSEHHTRLVEIIENYELHQSIEETFTPESTGPFFDTIDARATFTVDGTESHLQIEGAMYHTGTPTAMEHHEQAEGLLTLCEQFKSWADEIKEETFW